MGDLIRYGVIGTGMMGFEFAEALGLAAERSASEHRPVELAELGL